MTTKVCIHHWKLESPNGPFSLAVCKKCGEYDAVRNFFGETAWTQKEIKGTGVKNSEQARLTFLRERVAEDRERLKKIRKQKPVTETKARIPTNRLKSKYPEELKIKILLRVSQGLQVSEAAKEYKIPPSSIHDWKRIYSDWKVVQASGNVDTFKQLILEKNKIEDNVTKLAKEHNIPRRTLRNWREKK